MVASTHYGLLIKLMNSQLRSKD